MPLDALEADSAAVVGVAPRCVNADRRKFEMIVKVLQRDDPLRRSYVQSRWHDSTPSRAAGCPELERTYLQRPAADR